MWSIILNTLENNKSRNNIDISHGEITKLHDIPFQYSNIICTLSPSYCYEDVNGSEYKISSNGDKSITQRKILCLFSIDFSHEMFSAKHEISLLNFYGCHSHPQRIEQRKSQIIQWNINVIKAPFYEKSKSLSYSKSFSFWRFLDRMINSGKLCKMKSQKFALEILN